MTHSPVKEFFASPQGVAIALGLVVVGIGVGYALSHSANVGGNANTVNIVNNHYHAPLQSTQVQVQSTESSPSSAVPSDGMGRQLAVGTASATGGALAAELIIEIGGALLCG